MTEEEKLADELEKILSEINDETLAKLDMEDIMQLRKKLNPYGRTIEGSDKWLTFSFTNLREKYMEKLLMTALIGYLNRACDEWHVPDGIPVIPVYDYVKDPNKITDFAKEWKVDEAMEKNIIENAEWMKKRVIVKEFLEEMFQFNPDEHIRSAYKPNYKDLDRSVIETPAANIAIRELSKKDAEFNQQRIEYDRIQNLRHMKSKVDEKLDPLVDELVSKQLMLPEQHYTQMDFSTWSHEDKNVLYTVCNMIPPADIFYKFTNYYENNYDKIREAVLYLYCEKPDLDIAINPYQWHDDENSAIEFQKKHRNEVITDIIKAYSGKWNFFAPFAKVHNTVKFFNEKTKVLEEMTKQIESDQKLGADLMKKKIIKKKKKNIKEVGPETDVFKKWKESNSLLKDLGAETPNKDSYAVDEIPDDAIQVDVWKVAKGGLELKKEHFFSKAEPPSFIEEDLKEE